MPPVRRFFLCSGQCVEEKDLYKYPDAHILGDLRYVTDEGRKVTALALWLVPTSARMVPPLLPVVVAFLVGDARMIRCRFADCARSQRWEIGRGGMLALMGRVGLQDAYLELEREQRGGG